MKSSERSCSEQKGTFKCDAHINVEVYPTLCGVAQHKIFPNERSSKV